MDSRNESMFLRISYTNPASLDKTQSEKKKYLATVIDCCFNKVMTGQGWKPNFKNQLVNLKSERFEKMLRKIFLKEIKCLTWMA
jgi:hypothetical protein